MSGVTGFTANLKVDDGGTGAAPGGVSTAFAGLVMFTLPSAEAGTFNATELDQSSAYEVDLPTGLIQQGKLKATVKFTKANYQRLKALNGVRGHAFVAQSPDDLSTPGTPVKLSTTWTGFVSKVDEVTYDKQNQVVIPFEVTVQGEPTVA